MNIQVTIELGANEYASDLAANSTELAEQVLAAAGGDVDKDTCHVSIRDYGSAGVSSEPVMFTPLPPPTPPVPAPVQTSD